MKNPDTMMEYHEIRTDLQAQSMLAVMMTRTAVVLAATAQRIHETEELLKQSYELLDNEPILPDASNQDR